MYDIMDIEHIWAGIYQTLRANLGVKISLI